LPVGAEGHRHPRRRAFGGQTYHTAALAADQGVDFSGKRVAVIGTGSSAVQSIPLDRGPGPPAHGLSAHAGLQPAGRQPAAGAPDEIAAIKANYREHREAARHSAFGVPMPIISTSALEVSADVSDSAPTRPAGTAAP
jgi:cation diffusion facilitator CzcD-associated flavoprotein CzcO